MSKVTNNIGQGAAARPPKTSSGRRDFLRGLGLGAAGAATLGVAGLASTPASADATLDAEILTFALNLEYLEAEFYHLAVLGTGLGAGEIGPSPGVTTGGRKINFDSPQIAAIATEIQREEEKHVRFLQAALTASTGSFVSRPNLDFQNSFPALAVAAGLGTGFDAFADDESFLLASYVFEDVGVTAYHGAATLISNSTYLDKAAGIMAVEAYHAATIRTVLFYEGMHKATTLISNLRASLDGTLGTANQDDFGVGSLTDPHIVDCSRAANGATIAANNAIAFDRTTRQVLNIVYGAQNASSGLFFPSGLNGAIH